MSELTPNSIVVAEKEQLSSKLGDETVILQLLDGVYFGLDAVGTRIWSLIEQPRRVSDICRQLMEEYDVDAERCERSVLKLLHELADAHLIKIVDEPAA